MKTKRPNLAVL